MIWTHTKGFITCYFLDYDAYLRDTIRYHLMKKYIHSPRCPDDEPDEHQQHTGAVF